MSRFVHSRFVQLAAVHSVLFSALRQGEVRLSGYLEHEVVQLHGVMNYNSAYRERTIRLGRHDVSFLSNEEKWH